MTVAAHGARLGVLLLGASAAAACADRAAAQAPPPLVVVTPSAQPPEGWVALPRIAEAARGALVAGAAPTAPAPTVAAWGDPGAGCYAVWLALGATRTTSLTAERTELERALAPLGVASLPPVVAGATRYEQTLAITSGRHAGQLQLALTRGTGGTIQLAAVACVHNEREPRTCTAACTPLLGTMAPTGTP